MVGDAHVPAAAATAAVSAAADGDEPDELVDEVEPLDEPATEGAVGTSLFENWQPVSIADAATITANTQIFLILVMSRYAFVCAHTILRCATNSNA